MSGAQRDAARDAAGRAAVGPDADLREARRVADSVLYEGYVLFPYRASARKNQFRWQFGVVRPPDHADERSTEPSAVAAEFLLVGGEQAEVEVRARFLRARRRDVQAPDGVGGYRSVERLEDGDRTVNAWDEGVEAELVHPATRVSALIVGEATASLDLPGARQVEPLHGAGSPLTDPAPATAGGPRPTGRVVRTTQALAGSMRLRAETLDADRGLVTLRVEVANRTPGAGGEASRDEILRRSLLGLHLLVSVRGGGFVSLQDPPEWARAAADGLTNRHLYPVLVGSPGSDAVMLASPIILYDHPEVAPESPGDSFDATEIDELLARSVASLTDAEKREARATDPRAAELIDRAEHLPAEWLERLHGALRQPGTGRATSAEAPPGEAPQAHTASGDEGTGDEFADFFGVGEPPTERLAVGDGEIVVGGVVRLHPLRRADAQDLFVDGRTARVQRIVTDVDGSTHVGVTLEDDPGAELHLWHGRFLYFHPEEVVPLEAAGADPSGAPAPRKD